MMHYGYSTDIKRILATYPLDEVRERLFIDKVVENFDVERYVVLPKYFVKKMRFSSITSNMTKRLREQG